MIKTIMGHLRAMTGKRSAEQFAVVAGLDLNGLGLLRALGHAGIPLVGLDTDLHKPTAVTRFGHKKRIAALSGPKFIDALLELRAQFLLDPVLLLTQEASVATVSAFRERLSNAYRFSMPTPGLMEQLLDKHRFQALAECHGYPIPLAVRVSNASSLDTVQSLRFPCVLKPTTKDPEYGKRFAKAYKVYDADEVFGLWATMRAVVDEIIVQEWIEGPDSDVYFCLQYRPPNGERSVSFVGRKICQWPIQLGGTASCMPAPEAAAELIALTDGFFGSVGYIGVGSMEYKRDSRDGKFLMVEPTVGRTDYQEEIAALNGVNIPLAAYFGELGLPMPIASGQIPPRAWRDPFGYANARKAGAADPMKTLSPGIKICDAYGRLSDPMPYVALKLEAAQQRLSQARRLVQHLVLRQR